MGSSIFKYRIAYGNEFDQHLRAYCLWEEEECPDGRHLDSADASGDADTDQGPANSLPKPSEDPAEGSSEVIDRELQRPKKGAVTPSK
jgi:hypothetical protein